MLPVRFQTLRGRVPPCTYRASLQCAAGSGWFWAFALQTLSLYQSMTSASRILCSSSTSIPHSHPKRLRFHQEHSENHPSQQERPQSQVHCSYQCAQPELQVLWIHYAPGTLSQPPPPPDHSGSASITLARDPREPSEALGPLAPWPLTWGWID